MVVREAIVEDWPEMWAIFEAVVATGDTYAYAPGTDEETARRTWTSPPAVAFVAVEGGGVVGTYTLRPNQPDLGAHVANAGFMVAPGFGGRGVGRAMAEHALAEARRRGYLAMQFNYVVSTNERAVALRRSLGFAVVGAVPKAFRHSREGLVDVFVMHRFP